MALSSIVVHVFHFSLQVVCGTAMVRFGISSAGMLEEEKTLAAAPHSGKVGQTSQFAGGEVFRPLQVHCNGTNRYYLECHIPLHDVHLRWSICDGPYLNTTEKTGYKCRNVVQLYHNLIISASLKCCFLSD